jgi:hypothetical protein
MWERKNLQEGGRRRPLASADEPRSNALTTWFTYLDTSVWLANAMKPETKLEVSPGQLGENEDRMVSQARIGDSFLRNHVGPIIDQYISDTLSNTQWRTPAVARIFVTSGRLQLFKEVWRVQNQIHGI